MANLLFMLYSATSVLFLPLASSYQSPCDSLTPEYCALPFPSSYYTAPDPSTATGLKVNFSSATFPLDIIGRGVNPAEWNTLGRHSTTHTHTHTQYICVCNYSISDNMIIFAITVSYHNTCAWVLGCYGKPYSSEVSFV